MNNLKLVTVIVPVLNGEKTLRNCLDSILLEDSVDFELLVVDNNSNDKTKEIIEEFKNKDNRVKYIFGEKRSLGAARNYGVQEAKGSIVIMTDVDCVVPKNWIPRLIQPILEEDENIVMGFQHDIVNNFWSKLVQKADEDHMDSLVIGKYIRTLDPKNFSAKTEVLKEIKFSDEQVYLEDFDFYIRAKDKYKVRFLKDLTVGHLNKTNLRSIIKTNFIRAYWAAKSFNRNKNTQPNIKKEKAMSAHNFKKIILSPLLVIMLFFKNPPTLAIYKIIVGVSWLVGTVWYHLTHKYSNSNV